MVGKSSDRSESQNLRSIWLLYFGKKIGFSMLENRQIDLKVKTSDRSDYYILAKKLVFRW